MIWLVASLGLLASIASCRTVLPRPLTVPSQTLPAPPQGAIGQLAATYLTAADHRQSVLHLLADAQEALDARLFLIEQAQRSIDVQYYILRHDTTGKALLAALRRAALRGVRVRLLLDGWGTRPDSSVLQDMAAQAHTEVRLFNPLDNPRWPLLSLLFDFEQGQRRMHNKSLLVDGLAAIVGGRNLGDEYFERRREFAFADIDVLVFGPVLPDLSSAFDEYWNDANSAAVIPMATMPAPDASLQVPSPQAPVTTLPRTDFAERLKAGALRHFAGRVTAVYDLPGKVNPNRLDQQTSLGRDIARVMGEARSELLIVSPYFVPGQGGVDQLRALAARGVRVTVVTNSLAATDVPAVHAGYARYRAALLRAGVALYELRVDATGRKLPKERTGSSRVSLHAKVIVVDQAKSFIGSMNIDPRSLRLNTENGVVIDSNALASELAQGVERDLVRDAWKVQLVEEGLRWSGQQGGTSVIHEREPQASLWLRLKTTMMSWLPLEGLL